jgi:hypothetical protein
MDSFHDLKSPLALIMLINSINSINSIKKKHYYFLIELIIKTMCLAISDLPAASGAGFFP